MIAIVCGGRDYANEARLRTVLDAAVTRRGLDTIIEGEATGADTLARQWAEARGDIGVIAVAADWGGHGASAGPRRNKLMLDILVGGDDKRRARCVIAFPGGRGTGNMVLQARGAGVEVFEVK